MQTENSNMKLKIVTETCLKINCIMQTENSNRNLCEKIIVTENSDRNLCQK